MIVDDSAVARSVLTRMLAYHPEFEIVATAASAADAVNTLKSAQVDIVLLDLEMPGGSGLAALPEIIRHGRGARILVVSSTGEQGSTVAAQALALGAHDILAKPGAGHLAGLFSETLVDRLRRLVGVGDVAPAGDDPSGEAVATDRAPAAIGCIAIGASTGGLNAIIDLLCALPARTGIPLLVTQHLPAPFLVLFARQIALGSGRHARLAEDGAELRADEILLAPGDAHLGLARDGGRVTICLSDQIDESGCMPSVDVMLASLAAAYGPAGLGVVLSGMGRDGLAGSRALARAGGTILAQDRASAAVWGMPGAVSRAGLAAAIGTPRALGTTITSWLEEGR